MGNVVLFRDYQSRRDTERALEALRLDGESLINFALLGAPPYDSAPCEMNPDQSA